MIKENNISLREYKKEFEIYEKSITIQCIADKETAERLKCNIGDKYTTKNIPKTREEALERLTNYDAMQFFFALVKDFNDKYSLNSKTLKDELDTLNQFIEKADKIKMDEAINIYNINHNPSKNFEYEYIKLKNGHYENKKFYNYFSFFDNLTPIVKAKYFLYKDYLENELSKLEDKFIIEKPQKNQNNTQSNAYNEIFSNNGFVLFEHILNEYVRPKGTRGRFSDIADYYWKLYNSEPQYIHQRPETFKKWFYKKYDEEDIGKIKTADKIKDLNRNRCFSTSLDWFKT